MILIIHGEQELPSADDVFVHIYTSTVGGQMCTLTHTHALIFAGLIKQTTSLGLHKKQEKCHYVSLTHDLLHIFVLNAKHTDKHLVTLVL